MKKLSVVALVAALIVVVLLPARAEANHTLAHKVKKLQGKVAALQGKVNCLRRTGASTYLGYPYYEGTLEDGGSYPIHSPSTGFADTDFAVNFDQATGVGGSDYWLLTLSNTRFCRSKFRVVSNPYVGRVAMRTAAIMNLRRLSRIQ